MWKPKNYFPLQHIPLGNLSWQAIAFLRKRSGVSVLCFVLFVWGCFWNRLYWYLLQKCCEARLSSHHLHKFIYTNDEFHSGILQHIRSWRLSSKALFLPGGHHVGLTTAINYKPGAWAKGWDFSWCLKLAMGGTWLSAESAKGNWVWCSSLNSFGSTILARRPTRTQANSFYSVCLSIEDYAVSWHVWVGISTHPLLQTSINTAISTTFESGLAFSEILQPQQAGEEKMGLSLPTQRKAAV